MAAHPVKKEPTIAFIYDRLNTQYGGAEVVLRSLHHIFPDAPLYTSVYDLNQAVWAKNWEIIPSFLQKIPGAAQFHRLLVPLMPLAFESLSVKKFDIVLSVTSAEAKGVLTLPEQLHICYLLTPTRYLWSHREEYAQDWITGWVRNTIFKYVRWWDEAAAGRPDVYIPISELIARRCQQFYKRSAESVIYPPFELENENKQVAHTSQEVRKEIQSDIREPYYLIVSRLVSYKRIDIAIEACQELGRNLIIIMEGPDFDRLQLLSQSANPNSKIIFRQAVQPEKVRAYYSHCRAFLLFGEEDFGITAVEAQSFGKPVLIYHRSGAAEIIKDKITGIHVASQTVAEAVAAIKASEQTKWDEDVIRANSAPYTATHFEKIMKEKILSLWKEFKEKGRL